MLSHKRSFDRRMNPARDFSELKACIVRSLDTEEAWNFLGDVPLDDPVVSCEPLPSPRPQIPDAELNISSRDVPGSVLGTQYDWWFRIACRYCRADAGEEFFEEEEGLWEHVCEQIPETWTVMRICESGTRWEVSV